MVKVETLKEEGFVRILRCREGNRVMGVLDREMVNIILGELL